MEHVRLGLATRTFLVAASLGLAACSSISEQSLNDSSDDPGVEETTTTAEPVITVAPTVQTTIRDAAADDAEGDDTEAVAAPTTAAPTTAAPTTAAPTTAAAAATSTTVENVAAASGDDEELAAAAQLQDDEEGTEELPNTGPNETMLVIAIGCALIVGGRTLVDLVNAAARAIQAMPARSNNAPPR